MPAESAADRAVFFNTDDFAVAATWTLAAGGSPVDIDLILDRPDAPLDFGPAAVQATGVQARCAVVDLPAGYGKGDTLTVGATSWRVSRVDLDLDRVLATVALKAI